MAHAGYLTNVFVQANLKITVEKTLKELEPLKDSFDSIAFRGLSGGLIASIICYQMKKGMVAVRKDKKIEASHSQNKVESETDNIGRFIILDDQISSGTTVREMLKAITDMKLEGKCVGIYTYQGYTPRGSVWDPTGQQIPRIGSYVTP